MGWNDHLDVNELEDLPPEVWDRISAYDGLFDPDNHWLRNADRDDQLAAIRAWFFARFCDPSEDTPYNGREGGYIFANGGPFNPEDELAQRFSGIVDDEVIEEVVDEMVSVVGDEWAPRRINIPDDYDPRFDFILANGNEPLRRLKQRLIECECVIALEGEQSAKKLAQQLVFSGVIGVLESFLWETAQHWLDTSDDVLRAFITKLPVLRDEPIKLGDIFKRLDSLRVHVKGHLQNTVWHRWDKVGALYKAGLGIDLPSVKLIDAALEKRHDIVHRSGHDKDGTPITIDVEQIHALSRQVETFATEITKLLAERFSTRTSDGIDAPDF